MKKYFTTIFAVFSIISAYCQTNATDFTANDCSGTSHNLFTELNAGKVVVLVWVMPCALCINDARGAYDAVQGFATSNPGKVLYFLADDNGGTSCNTLQSWALTNGIKDNVITFRNSGSAINENDFGGTGMPHVVVIGPDKQIFFNELNGEGNQKAIESAISQALLKTSVPEIKNPASELNLYPNPARETILFSYDLTTSSTLEMGVYNALGEKVKDVFILNQPAGKQQLNIDLNQFENGIYFLKMSASGRSWNTKFVVAK